MLNWCIQLADIPEGRESYLFHTARDIIASEPIQPWTALLLVRLFAWLVLLSFKKKKKNLFFFF